MKKWFSVFGLCFLAFLGWNFYTSASTIMVEGVSMSPTLADGELLSIDRNRFIPKNGDIIIIRRDGSNYVKRVMGVPGDTISITAGKIYRNGSYLEDEGGIHSNVADVRKDYPLTLHEGEYFVLGDNRSNSWDSRSESFGIIYDSEIFALVIPKE